MKFEFGEILSRAGQITWKHKILWLFSALPILISLLIFPVIFLPIFFSDFDAHGEPFFVEQPIFILLFIGFGIFVTLLSFAMTAISSSSVTLGVVQVEGGAETLTAAKLFDNGRQYWLRILGIMLLVGLGVSLIFAVIFGCMALFGAVTMGIGFICMQPLFLLMYPLMLVLYGIIEESQAAVVVDELGVVEAIQRGWELVKANFWNIVLISLVVYIGLSILGGIAAVPFMIPFFFMPFFMQDASRFSLRGMMLIMGGVSLIFVPVMALVQGIGMTFLKATYALVYLRLTRKADTGSDADSNNRDNTMIAGVDA
jgi:hypothetical protein